jgi:hypothetical protein
MDEIKERILRAGDGSNVIEGELRRVQGLLAALDADHDRLLAAIAAHRDEFQGPGAPCPRDLRLWEALDA